MLRQELEYYKTELARRAFDTRNENHEEKKYKDTIMKSENTGFLESMLSSVQKYILYSAENATGLYSEEMTCVETPFSKGPECPEILKAQNLRSKLSSSDFLALKNTQEQVNAINSNLQAIINNSNKEILNEIYHLDQLIHNSVLSRLEEPALEILPHSGKKVNLA